MAKGQNTLFFRSFADIAGEIRSLCPEVRPPAPGNASLMGLQRRTWSGVEARLRVIRLEMSSIPSNSIPFSVSKDRTAAYAPDIQVIRANRAPATGDCHHFFALRIKIPLPFGSAFQSSRTRPRPVQGAIHLIGNGTDLHVRVFGKRPFRILIRFTRPCWEYLTPLVTASPVNLMCRHNFPARSQRQLMDKTSPPSLVLQRQLA